MKLLVFADPHLHDWSNHGTDPATGLSKRLVEQQGVMRQIIAIAKEEKVNGVLCLGDVMHALNPTTGVINTAYLFFQSLRQLGIATYFVAGNHDLINRKDPKWWHYSCKIFGPQEPPANIKIIGYHEEIDYEKTKGFDVVAIHKTPIDAQRYGYTFKEGFDWRTLAKNNKLVVCGHIHQRQQLAKNFIIVGAPMHHNFADSGDRGIYLVDTDTGTAEFRKLKYPEFITVENYSDTRDDGNYYRVLQKDSITSDSLQTENIKVQASPVYLPERIKSTTFHEILKEWLVLQEKPETYLELLSDIVDDKFQLGKKLYQGRLYQVMIKDFLSIGDVTYKVENGFTLVVGQNDIFNSNGSGKSSLFEAIYWCLFGKTTKELTGDDVIRNRPTLQKDCKVSLWLRGEDSSELHITRSREEGIGIFIKRDGDLFHDISGERTQQHCQKLLEEILGFDEKLFRTSCYFSQENLLMLTGLEDANRTKMITDLLGFESYNDLYAKAHKKIEKLSETIVLHNNAISVKETQIANTEGKLLVHRGMLSSAENIRAEAERKIFETENLKQGSELELQNLVVVELPYRDFEKEAAELKVQEEKRVEEYKRLEQQYSAQHAPWRDVQSKHEVARNEVKHVVKAFESLKRELEVVKNANEGAHCLLCGSLVSKESKEQYLLSKAAELNSKLAAKEKAEFEVERLSKLVKVEEELSNKYLTEMNAANSACTLISAQSRNLEKERREYITKRQAQLSLRSAIEARIRNYTERIEDYKVQLAVALDQLTVTKETVVRLQEEIRLLEEAISNFKTGISVIQSQIGILEFWKVAFSPKGIRALLLDKFCNDFNQVVNSYLHEISNDNMGLMVTPTAMTKGGEERNKIGMTVYFKDYEVKYASLSGGEKRRVDCSLIFALSKYLEDKYQLGAQGLLGVLVLDEVFGGLDKSGEDTLMAVLDRESKNKAIFIIDHLLNLTGSADRVWTVGKVDDVSFLNTESNENLYRVG